MTPLFHYGTLLIDVVVRSFCCILESCLEEFEELEKFQDVLESLLLPLLPASKAENSASYRLAGTVLKRVSPVVQVPISAFINKLLLGSDHDEEDPVSELETGVYVLIFELHKISPSLLTRVLPNICQQLEVENETVRLHAVKLLGSLFSSPSAEYASEFPRNLREYLNRLKDKSVTIRREVASACAAIIVRDKALIKHIEGIN